MAEHRRQGSQLRWVAVATLLLLIGNLCGGENATTQEATALAASEGDSNRVIDIESSEARELKGKKKVPGVPAAPVPIPYPVQVVPVVQVAQPPAAAMERHLSCPPGFDLVGERCVTNDVVQPDFTCPPDTQLSNEQCVQIARPRRECPDGFQLSGASCVVVDVVPVQFTCPEGFLDETGRSCRVIRAGELKCPPGFTLHTEPLMPGPGPEVCIQKFAAQVECPMGYVYSKKGCTREVAMEAAPMCPAGSELDSEGKKCFTMKHSKPKCPKGFKMSGDGTACIKQMKKMMAGCPSGFEEKAHHGAVCERVVQLPPQLSCPTGSTLDQITGQCAMEILGSIACPKGFSQSGSMSHMCERVVEEVGSCPPGTAPLGVGALTRCQSVIEHEIIECCPPGFDVSPITGRCERREVFRAIAACEDCVKVRTLRPSLSCPEGFISQHPGGMHCVRQVPQPCGPEQNMVSLPPPMPLCDELPDMPYYGGGSLRSLYGGPRPACRQRAEIATGERLCTVEEIVPAEVYCPAGDFDGVNCVQRTSVDHELKCANGSTLDPISGQCIRVTSVPMKTECVPGTTRIGNRCVEYQDHPPQFSCPPEAQSDSHGNCVILAPALSSAPEVLRSNPVPLCPAGTLSGRMCYDVERVPRQPVCPEGSVPQPDGHDKCMMVTEFVVSPPTKKYSKPKFFCSDGTPARGKHCHSHEQVPPSATCPAGSTVEPSSNGRLCIRTMTAIMSQQPASTSVAVPVCPPGAEVQGTKCVVSRQTEAAIICPPGYVPDGGPYNVSCIRAAPLVPICPAGSLQTADGCLRQRSVAPTVDVRPAGGCFEPSCY